MNTTITLTEPERATLEKMLNATLAAPKHVPTVYLIDEKDDLICNAVLIRLREPATPAAERKRPATTKPNEHTTTDAPEQQSPLT